MTEASAKNAKNAKKSLSSWRSWPLGVLGANSVRAPHRSAGLAKSRYSELTARVLARGMVRMGNANHRFLTSILLLGIAAAPATRPEAPATARLTVKVVDLRNHTGDLVFGVFKSADGFPSDPAKSVNWQVAPAAGGGVFTVDLPPGTYAASVLHDENRNGHIDTNFLGIPTEGYGVTNNPKPKRRAATFGEATFTLPPGGATLTLSVQYDFI